jgi:hypothetical protein
MGASLHRRKPRFPFFATPGRWTYHQANLETGRGDPAVDPARPRGVTLNLCLKCGRLYDGELTRCPRDGEELLPYEATVHDGEHVADVVLGRMLGIGPCGKIVEGTEVATGRRVVVRLLGEELVGDKAGTDQLLHHLQQAKSFVHPGAVAIRAVVAQDTRVVVVREAVEGERLEDLLARDEALPADRALRITAQICTVLAAAHKVGLLHLQVRASNVFLVPDAGPDHDVRLLDFGIGPPLRIGARRVFGATHGLAPEQVDLKLQPSAKTDIFATGLLLYHMLTGRTAYPRAGDPAQLLTHALPPLCAPNGTAFPAGLDGLVRSMADRKPPLRPANMEAVLVRLRVVLQELQAIAARPSQIPRAPAAPVPRPMTSRGRSVPIPEPQPDPDGDDEAGQTFVMSETDMAKAIEQGMVGGGPARPAPAAAASRPGAAGPVAGRAPAAARPSAAARPAPSAKPIVSWPTAATAPAPAAPAPLPSAPIPAVRRSAPTIPPLAPPAPAGSRKGLIIGVLAAAVVVAVALAFALRGSCSRSSASPPDSAAQAAPAEAGEPDAAPVEPAPPETAPPAPDAAANVPVPEPAADVVAETQPAPEPEAAAPDVPAEEDAVEPADEAGVVEAAVGEPAPQDAGTDGQLTELEELVYKGNRASAGRRWDEARQLFESALALDERNRGARLGIGRAYFQLGEFEKAVEYLEPLVGARGSLDLGNSYIRLDRIEDARQQFTLILNRDPSNADAARGMASLPAP